MPKTTDSVIFSDVEQTILEAALQNPDLSNAEIAERTGARLTLVRDTRANYEDDVELAEDVAERAEESTELAATVDDADLSETQAEILDAVAGDPTLSNAEIADETGARIALVRDTRAEYGDAVEATAESADESADDAAESSSTEAAEPSDRQAAILELAAENPDMTNAEIAAETGARITLVRDTRSEFGGATAETEAVDSAAESAAEIDTDGFSETQIELLETVAANPELTNAEIADETGTRITLVRDTISQHESDDSDTAAEETTASDDDTDVLADVDTAAFSGAQLEILEIALSNPELTNGEIADETGSRIALVRDTLYEHEYDDKPWDKDLDDDGDDADTDEDDEVATPSEEPIEMPETTASDLLSEAERAILEAALSNPELTNAEIAEETGARLTLVRDTRATYEAVVDLPDEADNAAESGSADTDTTGEPTERQREILEAIGSDPERTNAEIAAATGARITFVRDTRAAYDAEVADSEDDAVAETASAEVDTADEVAAAEDTAEDTTGAAAEDTTGAAVEDTTGAAAEDTTGAAVEDTAEAAAEDTAEAAAEQSSGGSGTAVLLLIVVLLLIGLGVALL